MHAGVGGEQERDVIGTDGKRARTDRVVDDVNAVGHRLVDGGGQVGAEATQIAEALVGDDPGARSDSGDLSRGIPKTLDPTPAFPAAVEAVCVP